MICKVNQPLIDFNICLQCLGWAFRVEFLKLIDFMQAAS